MQNWKEQRRVFMTIAAAPTLWLLLFFLVPLAIMWAYSFGTNSGLTKIDITGTFANYARAIEPLYLGIFLKSVGVAALTTLICLIVGFPVAMAITFAGARWKPWLLMLIMLPFWTNLLVRTYALLSLLGTRGVVNQMLEWGWGKANSVAMLIGAGPIAPFEPLPLLYNNFAVIFGLVYVHLPFMVLPLYATLEKLDVSLLEAAADLGARPLRAFLTVTLPLSMPGVVAGCLLVFIPAVGEFVIPDLLGGTETLMIGKVLWDEFFANGDWPLASAVAVLMLALLVLPIVLFQRAGAGARPH